MNSSLFWFILLKSQVEVAVCVVKLWLMFARRFSCIGKVQVAAQMATNHAAIGYTGSFPHLTLRIVSLFSRKKNN